METVVLVVIGAWLVLIVPAVVAPFLSERERSPAPPEPRKEAPPPLPAPGRRPRRRDERAAA